MALSGKTPEARARQLANLRTAPSGNRRTLQHGANASPRMLPVEGKSRAIYVRLAADTPLRENGELPQADRTVVELLALCLARIESVATWIEQNGTMDPKTKEPRAVLDLERRLRVEARGHADALGLGTVSRVALGLDLQRLGLSSTGEDPQAAYRAAVEAEAVDDG